MPLSFSNVGKVLVLRTREFNERGHLVFSLMYIAITIACTCTVDDFSLRFQAFFLISPVSGPSTPVWRIGDLLPELKV